MSDHKYTGKLLKTTTLSLIMIEDLDTYPKGDRVFRQDVRNKANNFSKAIEKSTEKFIEALYAPENEEFFLAAQKRIHELVDEVVSKTLEEILCAEIELTE